MKYKKGDTVYQVQGLKYIKDEILDVCESVNMYLLKSGHGLYIFFSDSDLKIENELLRGSGWVKNNNMIYYNIS